MRSCGFIMGPKGPPCCHVLSSCACVWRALWCFSTIFFHFRVAVEWYIRISRHGSHSIFDVLLILSCISYYLLSWFSQTNAVIYIVNPSSHDSCRKGNPQPYAPYFSPGLSVLTLNHSLPLAPLFPSSFSVIRWMELYTLKVDFLFPPLPHVPFLFLPDFFVIYIFTCL